MNLTNWKALLIAYLEAVPLVMLMVLVARFVLHVEEINVFKGIFFPLTLPLFFLVLNWLVKENHWIEMWTSVELTVSSTGAVSIFYDDFLRYIVLAVLFYLFFYVLNINILRLPERISNGSP